MAIGQIKGIKGTHKNWYWQAHFGGPIILTHSYIGSFQ